MTTSPAMAPWIPAQRVCCPTTASSSMRCLLESRCPGRRPQHSRGNRPRANAVTVVDNNAGEPLHARPGRQRRRDRHRNQRHRYRHQSARRSTRTNPGVGRRQRDAPVRVPAQPHSRFPATTSPSPCSATDGDGAGVIVPTDVQPGDELAVVFASRGSGIRSRSRGDQVVRQGLKARGRGSPRRHIEFFRPGFRSGSTRCGHAVREELSDYAGISDAWYAVGDVSSGDPVIVAGVQQGLFEADHRHRIGRLRLLLLLPWGTLPEFPA